MSDVQDNPHFSARGSRDEAIRQIIARCTTSLRAIGEEELARQIQMLPRVREVFDGGNDD